MPWDTRVRERWRRPWPRSARELAAVIGAAGLLTLIAGCGGSQPPRPGGSAGAPGSTPIAQPLAFSRCMRAHGVWNFPDPASSGVWAKSRVEVAAENPRFQAATGICGYLMPDGGPGVAPSPAVVRQIEDDMLKFARCMRSRGVPRWPDPTLDRGREIFDPQAIGIDPNAPRVSARMSECEHVFPASLGRPPGT